jgi:glutamate N-acetyltransferase/amino-acid N-acetyltransferase
MLAFITTDAAIPSKALKEALDRAVQRSFNCITVDGDMSTNDTVLVLANGMAGNDLIKTGTPQAAIFQKALDHVTLSLARMIVKDGEGITRVVTVRVTGARNDAEAKAAARSVANSSLVKTSWCGGDPNWGRILAALGYSSARVMERKIDVAYSLPGSRERLHGLRKGQPAKTSFKELCALVAHPEFELHIALNIGKGSAVVYACDLTEEYVDFNKGDVSNPAALGG